MTGSGGTGASPASNTAALGLGFAIGSFLIWALFPIYFKQLETVPVVEVLAHRVVWSAFFTAALLTFLGRWHAVAAGLASPRLIATLALSTLIISLNWGVFIWAISNSRVLDSSLGYYINPLVSVLLGVVVLQKRLRPAQWAAVALAAIGVGYEVLGRGELPWIALTLACSFAAYGLIRKMANVDPLTGLFIETLIASPVASGYLLVVQAGGCNGHFASGDARIAILLVLAGAITALPLLLFVGAARRIRLSTLGLLQYVVPTGHFLIAVHVYGEPLSQARVTTFVCIWIALLIYSLRSLRDSTPA
ncbi:MAG: EamA family transporter RarD [Hyphomicrobium sp.]